MQATSVVLAKQIFSFFIATSPSTMPFDVPYYVRLLLSPRHKFALQANVIFKKKTDLCLLLNCWCVLSNKGNTTGKKKLDFWLGRYIIAFPSDGTTAIISVCLIRQNFTLKSSPPSPFIFISWPTNVNDQIVIKGVMRIFSRINCNFHYPTVS